MLALLLRMVRYVGHALALVLGVSSLLFILLSLFAYAFGYGHLLGLATWLVIPFALPIITFLLLICLAITKVRHVWWLGSIGVYLLTCVIMFGLKNVGCWVYFKTHQADLQQAVAYLSTCGARDDFAVSSDGAYCLGVSPNVVTQQRALLESLHTDIIIKHGNCLLFSVDGMMTWHRGVLYSLDGNPPPKYGGMYYYNIAVRSVGGRWYIYDTSE